MCNIAFQIITLAYHLLRMEILCDVTGLIVMRAVSPERIFLTVLPQESLFFSVRNKYKYKK